MIQRFPNFLSCLAVTALLCVGGCDSFTSTDKRVARANEALDKGNLDAAAADARAALEKDPDHVGGWLLRARLALKYDDGTEALANLDRAEQAGASDTELRELRDRALLVSGRFDELVAQQAVTPDQQVTRATALAALDRTPDAIQANDELLAREPAHAGARVLQARLLASTGETGQAQAALERLLADDPDNAHAQLLKARLAMATGNTAAAVAALEAAEPQARVQLSVPEHATLLVGLTESLLATDRADAASSAVVRLREVAPRAPITEMLSARVSLAQGDLTTAVATLQRLLAANPALTDARLLLASALMEQGSTEQARTQINSLITEQPANLAARKLLARLLVSQGDPQGAERVLASLPEGVQADATSQWMLSSLLAERDPAQALALLEQAAAADPQNVTLQMNLVRTYLAAGRRADATRVLRAVPSQGEGMQSKQLEVLQKVAGVPRDQVADAMLKLVAEDPRDAGLRTAVGQILVSLDDQENAATQFRAALDVAPDLTVARLGLAEVLAAQGDTAAAAQELERIVKTDAADERAYVGLSMLANRQGDPAAARKWLERAISAAPSATLPRLALAELSYQENQTAAADALVEQALTVARDKSAVLQQIGEIQLRAAQPVKAAASLQRAFAQAPSATLAVNLYAARRAAGQPQPEQPLKGWLANHPQDAAVRNVYADYLLQTSAHREAIAEYEQLVQTNPAPMVLNNLAWLYQQAGDTRAEALARRAVAAAPDDPAIADTLGWVLLERGRSAEALPLLRRAAQGLPDNAQVQANLRRALQSTGEAK